MIVPDQGVRFNHIDNKLLLQVVVAAVGRGIIYNNLSAEYGHALQFWVQYHQAISDKSLAMLMLELEEAFDIMVETLGCLSDTLSIYSDLDHLQVRLIRYDPIECCFVLSINDG